ncbi:hypothetical protein MKX03_031992 [Papaver bracteatum]|nr:hypothetical protein MKX03_031992 [Papaver bracteatum]
MLLSRNSNNNLGYDFGLPFNYTSNSYNTAASLGHNWSPCDQQCLKTFSNEENKQFILKIDEHLRDHFVGEITQNALVLAQDPYGNYVVQYVVGQKIKETTRAFVKNLKGHFETLSTNKFSSHLVEKFLKESDDEFVIKFIIDELIHKSNTLMLLQDQYGNFVIQSAVNVAKVSMFNLIVNVIEMHYQSLRNHPYGKCVVLQCWKW